MVAGDDQHLLVATSSGIVKVDPRAGEATWALPLKGCGGALFVQQDRRLLATRGNGVVYWANGSLHVAAGGFSNMSRLLGGPDDSAWVFDTDDGSLTRIGACPGDERRYSIGYNPFAPYVYRPVWLWDHRFLFVGGAYSYIVDLDRDTQLDPDSSFRLPHFSPMGLCVLNKTTVVAASGDYKSHVTTVERIKLETMESGLVARVGRAVHVFDLVFTKDHHLFLLLVDIGDEGVTAPVIVQFDGFSASGCT
jgi:streptogramin lyase